MYERAQHVQATTSPSVCWKLKTESRKRPYRVTSEAFVTQSVYSEPHYQGVAPWRVRKGIAFKITVQTGYEPGLYPICTRFVECIRSSFREMFAYRWEKMRGCKHVSVFTFMKCSLWCSIIVLFEFDVWVLCVRIRLCDLHRNTCRMQSRCVQFWWWIYMFC